MTEYTKAECDALIAAAVKAGDSPEIIVHRLRHLYGTDLLIAYRLWKQWKRENRPQ